MVREGGEVVCACVERNEAEVEAERGVKEKGKKKKREGFCGEQTGVSALSVSIFGTLMRCIGSSLP